MNIAIILGKAVAAAALCAAGFLALELGIKKALPEKKIYAFLLELGYFLSFWAVVNALFV